MTRWTVWLVAVSVLAPMSARASFVTVPNDQRIQAALDGDADTVFVHGGYFRERLRIERAVALLAYPTEAPFFDEVPVVDGITIAERPRDEYRARTVSISRFTIHGPVVLPDTDHARWDLVSIEACRIDSGFVQAFGVSSGLARLRVRACTIMGDVPAYAYYVDFHHNTVIGGETRSYAEGELNFNSNVFLRSPGTALSVNSGGYYGVVDNLVDGARVGIESHNVCYSSRNVVRNCSEAGFKGVARYAGDRVEGGAGMGFDVGQDEHSYIRIFDCTVLGCGSTGIRARPADYVEIVDSRIGRCGGAGIEAQTSVFVEGNTVFRNAGSGIVAPGGYFERNIGFENGGYGLDVPIAAQSNVSCNDWFANSAGATHGVSPAPSDLQVDPLFCGIDSDDVQVKFGSPVIDVPACGLIGADSIGCSGGVTRTRDPGAPGDSTSSVPSRLALEASPNPARRGARVAFTLPEARDVTLEVLDVQGRQVARLARGHYEAGRHEIEWAAPRPGAYFLRLDGGSSQLRRTLVVVR